MFYFSKYDGPRIFQYWVNAGSLKLVLTKIRAISLRTFQFCRGRQWKGTGQILEEDFTTESQAGEDAFLGRGRGSKIRERWRSHTPRHLSLKSERSQPFPWRKAWKSRWNGCIFRSQPFCAASDSEEAAFARGARSQTGLKYRKMMLLKLFYQCTVTWTTTCIYIYRTKIFIPLYFWVYTVHSRIVCSSSFLVRLRPFYLGSPSRLERHVI